MTPAAPPVVVYLDPPGPQQRGNRLFDRDANVFGGDDIVAPFIAVRDHLQARGVEVRTADLLPPRPDGRRHLLLSLGTPDRSVGETLRRYAALAARPDVVLSAFLAVECPIVEPTLYRALPAIAALFRRVLSWTDTDSLLPFTGRPVAVRRFCWPQSLDAVRDDAAAGAGRNFLMMINANKLPRLYVNELYTERLRAVEFFHRYGEIDLYGRNWDGAPRRVGKTRTPATLRRLAERAWELRQRRRPDPVYAAAAGAWRGAVRSKAQTLSRYRYALCFENSTMKGYLTEKLFDCLFAGTIPIYRGAPDILDWVPAECFVDPCRFRDYGELRAYLHAQTPEDERRYREAAREFVASSRYDPFRLRAFVALLDGIVAEDAGASC